MPAPWQSDDLARELAYAIDGALWARNVLELDLDDWQQDLIRAHGAQLVLCSRQSGKSHSVAIRALHDLLYRPDFDHHPDAAKRRVRWCGAVTLRRQISYLFQ